VSARRSKAPRAASRASLRHAERVVEFDDVINRQRETIYEERNKVLRNEDLTATDPGRSSTTGSEPGRRSSLGRDADDWGMEALVGPSAMVRRRGDVETICGRSAIARRSSIISWRSPTPGSTPARRSFRPGGGGRRARAAAGEPSGRSFERLVLLRSDRSLWVEHLRDRRHAARHRAPRLRQRIR